LIPARNAFNSCIQRTQREETTVHQKGSPAGADTEGANQGWNQSFEKLAESLKEMST